MNDEIDLGLAEDEDLARAKAWWKDNGSSIIAGIVLGTAMVVGYNYWNTYKVKHAKEVAGLYATYEQSPQDSEALNALLASDATTVYAQLARLTAAKQSLESEQFEQVEQLLNAVLSDAADDGMRSVVELRLATVYLAQNKQDAAISLLSAVKSDSALMQGRVAELQADAYFGKGDIEQAKTYYAQSIKALSEVNQPVNLVQLKLDNL